MPEIQLWSAITSGQIPISRGAKLHFLSLVHVSQIPLYLAAGPSLNVSTDDEATAACLSQSLLEESIHEGQDEVSTKPWWTTWGRQSDLGILLNVEEEDANPGNPSQITKLLLYASIDTENASLPTPPGSSSPLPAGEDPKASCGDLMNAKVYALPLSSKIISKAAVEMLAISQNPEEIANKPACFLPNPRQQSQPTELTNGKRERLSSLFDDATQKRRKLKGQGGERVAQAMASLDPRPSQPGAGVEKDNEAQRQPPKAAQVTAARRTLSRTSSMPSMSRLEATRPASQSGLLANSKRSSLHRVESAVSPRDSPAFSDTDDNFGKQNKAALTKIVMAGMRLYGLQQKKKTTDRVASQGPSTAIATNGTSHLEEEAEDEYKLVYHQTFKATTFAFRKQISSQIIPQDKMRDTVDRFLDLFCTGPLASTSDWNDAAQPAFGTQGSEGGAAFDLPSVKTLSPATPAVWSTPTVKKR